MQERATTSSMYQHQSGVHGTPPADAEMQLTTRRANIGSQVGLWVSAGWLILSAVVGIFVMTAPTRVLDDWLAASHPSIQSYAYRSAYGGDAYTGIQNAAADTENAVVEGVNGLATMMLEIEESSAYHDAWLVSGITTGLGFLIISAGFAPFVLILNSNLRKTATSSA